ncbi:MAG TPA: hypothetical protein VM222_08460 [Planctomycetota bacterium]|nr:hypothetical protein [Planctomycetota bacterium]
MAQHVCEHLRALEDELVAAGRKITSAGQPWTMNCRYWITFDVVLDGEALKKRLKLPDAVSIHVNDDPRSGREQGLVCDSCHDGVTGVHPADGKGRAVIS